jgi:hypothetical protein
MEEWLLLRIVNDDFECEIIESILSAHDILCIKKECGAGGYLKIYMGLSTTGTQILVPAEQFARAVELIDAFMMAGENQTDDGPDNHEDSNLPDGNGTPGILERLREFWRNL